MSKNHILTLFNQGGYSVANLQKTHIYNPSLELVNDVYTIFGKILMSIKARYSVTNLGKTTTYNPNVDLVNDNVYTKFGLILSFCSQDIEQIPNSDINQVL